MFLSVLLRRVKNWSAQGFNNKDLDKYKMIKYDKVKEPLKSCFQRHGKISRLYI